MLCELLHVGLLHSECVHLLLNHGSVDVWLVLISAPIQSWWWRRQGCQLHWGQDGCRGRGRRVEHRRTVRVSALLSEAAVASSVQTTQRSERALTWSNTSQQ